MRDSVSPGDVIVLVKEFSWSLSLLAPSVWPAGYQIYLIILEVCDRRPCGAGVSKQMLGQNPQRADT